MCLFGLGLILWYTRLSHEVLLQSWWILNVGLDLCWFSLLDGLGFPRLFVPRVVSIVHRTSYIVLCQASANTRAHFCNVINEDYKQPLTSWIMTVPTFKQKATSIVIIVGGQIVKPTAFNGGVLGESETDWTQSKMRRLETKSPSSSAIMTGICGVIWLTSLQNPLPRVVVDGGFEQGLQLHPVQIDCSGGRGFRPRRFWIFK